MKKKAAPVSIEGLKYAHWVLMDYSDVVVHVFEDETRAYYELEKLWLDAPRLEVDEGERLHPKIDMTTVRGKGYQR